MGQAKKELMREQDELAINLVQEEAWEHAAEEEAEAEEHRAKAEAAEKVVRLQAEAEKNNAERSEDYEKYLKEEIKEAVSNCYQSGEKVVRYKKMTLTDINVLEFL